MLLRDSRSGLQVIERRECLRLLASGKVGRLAVVLGARPAIYPVNYALAGEEVVFRTDPGGKLDGALGRAVAFEIDEFDDDAETGWSVVVAGRAEEIDTYSSTAVRALLQLPLRPWAGGEKAHWLRIVPDEITGRRLDDAGDHRSREAARRRRMRDAADPLPHIEVDLVGPVDLADRLASDHGGWDDELDALHRLAQEVEAADGRVHEELAAVVRLVGGLRAKLERHVDTEDQMLFPAIARLAVGDPETPPRAVTNLISVMLSDHDHLAGLFGQLEKVTAGFDVPTGATADHRDLYERLASLESAALRHIEVADRRLFPSVLELVERAAADPRHSGIGT